MGYLASDGYNLIGNSGGRAGLYAATDLLNVNPHLGPLQNNGGATLTIALLPGSPAIDAGDPTQLGTADQRGVVRRGGVNIGAFQAGARPFVLNATASVTAGASFAVTVTAIDPFGQVAVGYRGSITFTSSDTAASLPMNYHFTASDAGAHRFAGLMLRTKGPQTITATDTLFSSLFGTLLEQVL
jgi:hypothetical protein